MPLGYRAEAINLSDHENTPPFVEHWVTAARSIDLGYPAISCWQQIEQAVQAGGLAVDSEIMHASMTDDDVYDQWVTLGIVLSAAKETKPSIVGAIFTVLDQLNPDMHIVALSSIQQGYTYAIQNDIGSSNDERKKVFRTNLKAAFSKLQSPEA